MTKALLLHNNKATKISINSLPPEAWDIISGPGSDSKRLYAEVAHLYACIDIRARGVYTLPWQLVDSRGEAYRFDMTEEPPISWFRNLDELLYKVAFSTLATGRAYLLADEPPRFLKADSIKERYNGLGELAWFRRTVKGQSVRLEVEDVIHFWLPDGETEIGPPSVYPAKVAINNSMVLRNLDKHLEKYFESGMIGVKILTGDMPAHREDREEVKTWWQRVATGISNAFSTHALDSSFDVKKVSDDLGDLHDGVLTKQQERSIEKTFGIPETKMSQAANLATKLQDNIEFIMEVITPHANWIAQTLNAQYLDSLGYTLQFLPNELPVMQKDEADRAASLQALVMAGVPLSDAAEELGYEFASLQSEPLTIQQPLQLPAPRTPEEQEEEAALRRWCRNREGKDIDPYDFSPDVLTRARVNQVVAQETGTAEDSPFTIKSTREERDRRKIERKHAPRIARQLELLRKSLIKTRADTETWEQRLSDPATTQPLRDAIVAMLAEAGEAGVTRGYDLVREEVFGQTKQVEFSVTSTLATIREWINAYSFELIRGITNTTRDFLRGAISDWNANAEPLSELVRRLASHHAFSEARAESIAVTETTRAYAQGNEQAWDDSGVVEGKQWVTANNDLVCPYCAPLGGLSFVDNEAVPADIEQQRRRGQTVSLGGHFVHPGGRSKLLQKLKGNEYDNPPAHPNCRCGIRPIVVI